MAVVVAQYKSYTWCTVMEFVDTNAEFLELGEIFPDTFSATLRKAHNGCLEELISSLQKLFTFLLLSPSMML